MQMTAWHVALLVFLLSPWIIAIFRTKPAALCLAALAVAALPPAIAHFRFITAVLALVIVIKTLQAAAGHEKPQGYFDFVMFLVMPVVASWDAPKRTDVARATRSALLGIVQIVAGTLISRATVELKEWQVAYVVLFQIELYLIAAGAFNFFVAPIALRGISYMDPFRSPFFARSPGEFWSQRWNTWVSHLLYRYVFLPIGGIRNPVRGVFASFAVSGLVHEAVFGFVAGHLTGWMMMYFLTQASLVLLTSNIRVFRRLTRRMPSVCWVLTMMIMLATGSMFVHGVDLALAKDTAPN